MGFRPGPPLGRASSAERRKIRASRRFRRLFRLNPSTLLIRRLLRTHGRGVERDGGGTGVPLTRQEVRDLNFRSRVEEAASDLDRFQRRCVSSSAAGLYLFDRRDGVHVAVVFTRDLGARRRQVLRRLRFGPLLVVRRARYTLEHLESVQDEIDDDVEGLRARGITIGATDLDVVHNRVEVEVRRGARRARRIMGDRYGRAVVVLPR
jgi:hypothetical protein